MEKRELKEYVFKSDEEFFCLDFLKQGVRNAVEGVKDEQPHTRFSCGTLVEQSTILESNYIRFFKELATDEEAFERTFIIDYGFKKCDRLLDIFLYYVYNVAYYVNARTLKYNILITLINESDRVCKKTNEEIEEIIKTTDFGEGKSDLMNCYYKIFPPKKYTYKRVLEILKK